MPRKDLTVVHLVFRRRLVMFEFCTVLSSPLDIKLFDYEKIKRLSTYGKPQEDFIKASIEEFVESQTYKLRKVAREYFTNDTEIQNKSRFYFNRDGTKVLDTTLSNSRLAHSIYRKLVNQKVNYLLSKPFSVYGKDKAVESLLVKYFNPAFLRQLQNITRYSIITGISWLQVYYNEEGKLGFKRIPENEVIPFWADADHTVLDAVIRFYDITEYRGSNKIEHRKIEYYTREGVWYYEQTPDGLITDPDKNISVRGHYQTTENKVSNGITELDDEGKPIKILKENLWERIPFVPIKYNTQELPLLKFIKSLLDDYDQITSDASDSIHDVPLSVRVVKNYDGTDKDEFLNNLKQLKLAFVQEDGDVTNLNIPLELEGVEIHLKRLRKDIYENGCGVDTQDENMRDTSGEALKFRYIDLSLDCQDLGVQVTSALESLAYFIFHHEKSYNSATIEDTLFQIIFNTDMITNETETINNCKNSLDLISKETILAHHPYVVDVEKELKKVEAEKEAELQREMDMQKEMLRYGNQHSGDSNE